MKVIMGYLNVFRRLWLGYERNDKYLVFHEININSKNGKLQKLVALTDLNSLPNRLSELGIEEGVNGAAQAWTDLGAQVLRFRLRWEGIRLQRRVHWSDDPLLRMPTNVR